MSTPNLFLPLIEDHEDKHSPLKNRIRKNYRHLRKWGKRTKTNCFRIYDRDIKEYPLAIDFYGGPLCVHYFASTRESETPHPKHYEAVMDALSSLFHTLPESIHWRTRVKREKTEQYEKTGSAQQFFTVFEYGLQFRVNLTDYLDTGLFLDHRETRRLVASMAKGKRLLNLFAYTCSFSVHAAAAGALFTKSVDLSNTYTEWGKENFRLNGLSLENNSILRADCLPFLEKEKELYDLIVIDPPTISRSKKMDHMFDIQKDYPFLISRALTLLSPGGTIIFSTNSRDFDFDESLFEACTIVDISKKTIPIDFHNQKIHRCWKIVDLNSNFHKNRV
ncbi:MAG: Ribosomal RNA large subunit methyltransferase K [Chlamydiales bacterium]|nr:Ribosomal RNA large subunit methyltransferase K [Chlamydiales bacterium]